MCNENCIWLNNVPYLGKDADKELARLIAASPNFLTLSTDEKQRLVYEMDKLIGLERLINQKHPKIGEEFFYLLSRVMHQVPLKSYVIARLYNEIEWLEE